jgi:hypothetical protein
LRKLYDDQFFDWVDRTAAQSAAVMLPVVQRMVRAESIVDVGCGRGTWLAQWDKLGISRIKGLDGDYVDRSRLAIDASLFEAADLSRPRVRAERFDLAQSLEVAEHLHPHSGPAFVAMLCSLSDVVLFSAAQPGQGGEDHINERPLSYWVEMFADMGYEAFDCVRPEIVGEFRISPWYRYNSLIFANAAGQLRLSSDALSAMVGDPASLDGGGNLAWRLRKLALRPLPVGAVTWLSRVHYSLACMLGRRQAGAGA